MSSFNPPKKGWLINLGPSTYRLVGLVILLAVLTWRVNDVLNHETYNSQYWILQLINGLILGGLYALVAMGYTLVYGILLMINFAHGEVMMIGGFAGYFALTGFQALGWTSGTPLESGLSVLLTMLVGMLASLITGIALERIAYRPLRNAPRLVPLISAVGASFFLQYTALLLFGVTPHYYQKPAIISSGLSIGDTFVTFTGLFIFFSSILLMVMLYLIVRRSKMGRAMRSVAESKEVSALMGVNVDKVIVFTFALGSVLAGAAGVMLGLHNTVMKFNSGFFPGIKAFTAAVIGGIGNLPGALLGAFSLGLLEAVGPSALGLPAEYKDVIAFSVLILVLIFRPTGILGEVLSEGKA
ncbi:MAG TPA: branched-chain amino acid ABC transporter permease [Anaerolineales bacterium]|nr:branched-chain amino acid ABC transporter permease [Anaerolineales bacterium]